MNLPQPQHPPHPETFTEKYWGFSLTSPAPAWVFLRKHSTQPRSALLALPLLTPSPARHLQQGRQLLIPGSFVKSRQWRGRGETSLTPWLRKEMNLYWTLVDTRHYTKSCSHTHEAPGELSQGSLTPAWGGCSCNDSRVTFSWGFWTLPWEDSATCSLCTSAL